MTQQTQTVDEFMSGGAKSATWPDDGAGRTVYEGEIVNDPILVQRKDYDTGELMFFKDSGKPAMQLVVHVQTDRHEDDDDDGVRAVYVRGQMRASLIKALRGSGDKSPQRGAWVRIAHVRDEPSTMPNGKPGKDQKIFDSAYRPAPRGSNSAAGSFMDENNAEANADGWPAGAQAERPAASASHRPEAAPQQAAGLACPEGFDAGKWRQMGAEQQAAVYDGLGIPRY